jgi:hypothetical protein
VGEDDVRNLKAAGYDDGQVIEIVLHVALNTWTNYVNEVAKIGIDFPVVTARQYGASRIKTDESEPRASALGRRRSARKNNDHAHSLSRR